jgi:hypothetical protein
MTSIYRDATLPVLFHLFQSSRLWVSSSRTRFALLRPRQNKAHVSRANAATRHLLDDRSDGGNAET